METQELGKRKLVNIDPQTLQIAISTATLPTRSLPPIKFPKYIRVNNVFWWPLRYGGSRDEFML